MTSAANATLDHTPKAGALQGALIIAAAVMPVMAIISLVPVLPMLEQEFASVAGSEFLVPIALTIPAFCLAVFSPFAGWMADRIGRKTLLVVALLLYAVLGTAPFVLTELKPIIASRFALGITEALIMTAATTLIGDYFQGPQRERWLGIQVSAISIAAIVLVGVGGALGQTLGSRGPFLMYLLALPLAIACQLFLFEPTSRTRSDTDSAQPVPLGRLAPLLFGGLLLGICFYVTLVKLGDILALVTTISPAFIGKMSAITNIGVALGTVVFGLYKGRLTPRRLITIGASAMVLGYAALTVSQSAALSVAAASVVCLGSGILIPTFLTWAMSFLSIAVRGRGIGLWQGCFFLGQFVAPITVVALAQALNGLAPALGVYAVLAAGLVLMFGVLGVGSSEK